MSATKLSGRQRIEWGLVIAASAGIVLVGAIRQAKPQPPVSSALTVEMTIKEIAPLLEVIGKGLA